MDMALIRSFQSDWLLWEPETIYTEIKDTFRNDVSELAKSKIQVLRTLHVSKVPWHSWQVFEKVMQGLNNNIPKWDLMQPLDVPQLYVGIDILDCLPDMAEAEFSDEVRLYMTACLHNEEVFFVPPPLDFLELEVSGPKYRCLTCGREFSALFSDGHCDHCTKRMSPEKGLGLRPDQELVEKGVGATTSFQTHDPTLVATRWAEVEHLPSSQVTIHEDEIDTQISKLLMARDYLNVRRRQLVDQLTSLKAWLGS